MPKTENVDTAVRRPVNDSLKPTQLKSRSLSTTLAYATHKHWHGHTNTHAYIDTYRDTDAAHTGISTLRYTLIPFGRFLLAFLAIPLHFYCCMIISNVYTIAYTIHTYICIYLYMHWRHRCKTYKPINLKWTHLQFRLKPAQSVCVEFFSFILCTTQHKHTITKILSLFVIGYKCAENHTKVERKK